MMDQKVKVSETEDFGEFLTQALYNRFNDVAVKELRSNKTYMEAAEKQSKILHELKELIPDHKQLLIEMDDQTGSMLSATEITFYRQGLVDGIALKRFLETWQA